MKQARDYRTYNVRLTSADWQRESGRVIRSNTVHYGLIRSTTCMPIPVYTLYLIITVNVHSH